MILKTRFGVIVFIPVIYFNLTVSLYNEFLSRVFPQDDGELKEE